MASAAALLATAQAHKSNSPAGLSCHTVVGRRTASCTVAASADGDATPAAANACSGAAHPPAPASPPAPATPQSSPPAPAAAAAAPPAAAADPPCRIAGRQAGGLVLGCRLFLGSQATEADAASLLEAGITHILQLGLPGELRATWDGLGGGPFVVYKQLRVADSPTGEDVIAVARAARLFLQEAAAAAASHDGSADPPGVLVHCAQGASRSAATLAALRMATEGHTAEAALAALTAARPVVSPNSGFLAQLAAFEQAGSNLDADEAAHAAAASSAGDACSLGCRRSEVRTLHETVRAFHSRDVGEESTVFECHRYLL